MPELPEVETVMRGLKPALEGATIARVALNRPDLRFPLPARFAQRLAGRQVAALSRRAKYILGDLDGGDVLVMHLGMSGRFQVETPQGSGAPGEFYYDGPRDPKHDHVVFHLAGGTTVTFNDARRFGFMDLVARGDLAEHRAFKGLGLEPLGNALDGPALAKLFAGKATSLKAALMDQRLVAGLGNIYVAEALHRAGLHPERLAGAISAAEAERLADAIRAVLVEAVEAGGSSFRDFTHADGFRGAFQERFRVYDREGEPCPACAGPIARLVQQGRSTYYCPKCQPRSGRRRAKGRAEA
jgi:formamidopyrimidine-DNA glycosylase